MKKYLVNTALIVFIIHEIITIIAGIYLIKDYKFVMDAIHGSL